MSTITLSINGKRVECPAAYPLTRAPEAGDLIQVFHYAIVLQPGDAGRQWVTAPEGLFEQRGAVLTPVAVTVADTTTLADLSPAQRARLRCVLIRRWHPSAEALLADTDPSRCVYVIVGGFDPPSERRTPDKAVVRRLPPIPAGCRHLLISDTSYSRLITYDWERLAGLTALETLTLSAFFTDLRPLCGMRRLRALSAVYSRAESLQPLSELHQLRQLELRNSTVQDLSPLSALVRLEVLSLSFCRGRVSLAPLSVLPALRHLYANAIDVTALPAGGWPALAHLEVLSAQLPEGEVAALRAAHPRCVVHADWAERFSGAVVGADRLRVRTGGTCHRKPDQERTLAEHGHDGVASFLRDLCIVPGPTDDEIDRLAGQILQRHGIDDGDGPLSGAEADAVRQDRRLGASLRGWEGALDRAAIRAAAGRYLLRDFRCRCCGDPTFEVYAGDRLLAMVGFHHGETVRWSGWPADASLQPGAAQRLRSLIPADYLLQ